jgi:chloramphenicol 3-O phosphotransferase
MSHIIILNGTSSSGKTSIAKALQITLAEDYLHFPLDAFLNMLPERSANYDQFHDIAEAMTEAAIAFLKSDHNIILDIVNIKSIVQEMSEIFSEYAPFLVKTHAPLEILNQREQERGDRQIGLAAHQIGHIHENILYDLEIDTSNITPESAARKIMNAHREFLSSKSRTRR